MTLSNHQRAARCNHALAAYSDYDTCTNLIDFLADAMHWCRLENQDFANALAVATRHYEIEVNTQSTDERTKP